MWVIHLPSECRNKHKHEGPQANKAEDEVKDELLSDYEDEKE